MIGGVAVVLAQLLAQKVPFVALVFNISQSQHSSLSPGTSGRSPEVGTLEAQVAAMTKRVEEAERTLREEREAFRKQLERSEERLQQALQEKARSGPADSQPARTEEETSAARLLSQGRQGAPVPAAETPRTGGPSPTGAAGRQLYFRFQPTWSPSSMKRLS